VGACQADHKAALLQADAQLKALRGQLTEALAGNHRRLQAAIQAHEATVARLSVVQQPLERHRLELRQAISQRRQWDSRHQPPLAIRAASAPIDLEPM